MSATRGRSGLATAVLVALTLGSGSAIAAAGPAALGATFLVQPGAPCVDLTGIADTGTGITLSQWRAGADPDSVSPIETVSAVGPLALPVPLCVRTVHAGDIVRLDQGAAHQTFSVPDLAVAVDLPNDRVTGIAASTASIPVVTFTQRIGGIQVLIRSGPATFTDGTIFTASSSFDLRRGDRVQVDWDDGSGLTVRAVRSTATATVRVGRVRIRFTGPPASLQSAVLRAADGRLRDRVSCRIQDNALPCDATFRKGGDPVAVRVGDRVRTSSANGHVRSTAAAHAIVDLATTPDRITAACPPKGRWLLMVGGTIRAKGRTPASGRIGAPISGNLGNAGATLACDDIRGFGQLFGVRLVRGH